MTIWQKQVLKLSLKILGAIILIAVIALFLYYHLYFKKDNLIKYVPQSAVFYSTFRLNDDLLNNKIIKAYLKDYNLDVSDFQFLNHFVAYNSAFAIIPDFESKKLKLDYLLIFNLKQDNLALEKHSGLIEKYDLKYDLLTYKTVGKNILIISNSEKVIRQVQAIAWQGKSSLAQKVDVMLNLNKFSLDYLARIYIDIEEFTANLDKADDLRLKLFLADLKADRINELFLGLKAKENNLVVKTLGNNSNEAPLLIEKISANFVLSFSLEKARDNIKQIYNLLREHDAGTFSFVEKNREYLEKLYKFNFEKDILELFAGQIQIILDHDNNYLFAINLANISKVEEKIIKLEAIIKEYLAVKYPIKKDKQLPDYTYISQIIKNPNIPNFKKESIYNANLHYLDYENQEFAYYYTEDVLFFANSIKIIENLIKDENLVDINKKSRCYNNKNANFSQNLIAKGEYLDLIWPYFSKIDYLVISENISDNGFWLCLE